MAAGDFSVQIPPVRRDGKKDELEVLIEDFNTMARELAGNEMLKSDFIATFRTRSKRRFPSSKAIQRP